MQIDRNFEGRLHVLLLMKDVVFGLIVGALIFIPLERVFALHREQRIFRRGWRTDVIHFLFTRFLADGSAFVFVGALVLLLHWLMGFSKTTFGA